MAAYGKMAKSGKASKTEIYQTAAMMKKIATQALAMPTLLRRNRIQAICFGVRCAKS